MVKRNLKTAVFTFIISVLFASSITATALAISTADSATNSYTVSNIAYRNMASIWIYNNGAQGRTSVDSVSGTVPAGYIGVYCRLYDASGTLKKSSGWNYNSSAVAGFSSGTSTCNTSGSYYSKGISKGYNGNGYNSYDTYQSPNLNY